MRYAAGRQYFAVTMDCNKIRWLIVLKLRSDPTTKIQVFWHHFIFPDWKATSFLCYLLHHVEMNDFLACTLKMKVNWYDNFNLNGNIVLNLSAVRHSETILNSRPILKKAPRSCLLIHLFLYLLSIQEDSPSCAIIITKESIYWSITGWALSTGMPHIDHVSYLQTMQWART